MEGLDIARIGKRQVQATSSVDQSTCNAAPSTRTGTKLSPATIAGIIVGAVNCGEHCYRGAGLLPPLPLSWQDGKERPRGASDQLTSTSEKGEPLERRSYQFEMTSRLHRHARRSRRAASRSARPLSDRLHPLHSGVSVLAAPQVHSSTVCASTSLRWACWAQPNERTVRNIRANTRVCGEINK